MSRRRRVAGVGVDLPQRQAFRQVPGGRGRRDALR